MTDHEDRYWKRRARHYDRAIGWVNRRVPAMARAVAGAVGEGGAVLEIAAGTGLVTKVVAPHAERYVATDSTPEMLDLLRQRMRGAENIEVRLADALSLEFPDSSFDAVVIANLLHLLEDPARALSEARRVLRAGGTLVVPTFAHGHGVLAKITSAALGLNGFPVVTRFRDDQLDTLVSEAGFQVVDARWFAGILPIRFVAARMA